MKKKTKFQLVRNSIRSKLVLMLTATVVFCSLSFSLVNAFFLPAYYRNQKMNALKCTYGMVNGIYDSSEMSRAEVEEAAAAVEKENGSSGISLYVFNLYRMYPSGYLPDVLYPSFTGSHQLSYIEQRVGSYFLELLGEAEDGEAGTEEGAGEILFDSASYGIYKAYDKRIDSDCMELFGRLDNGSFIYLVTSYQSMDDSIAIFNQFILWGGLGLMLVAGLAMYFISRAFTRPILDLSAIAKKMSDLDFSEKYQVDTQDEYGELGQSINILSNKLEMTISELQAANHELTREIENKIQIDEMRKEFLSNVSHELKTPIALIQGYAEGLLDNVTEDAESRQFYCEVIVDEAGKMNQMVKKLLSLNQLEFGNTPMEMEDFDILLLIQSVLHATRILTEQKGVSMHLKETGPVFVRAEEYWIEQVVTNYISNALNHVDGERRIDISVRQSGGLVRVEVFNTGAPIPEEELEKIWIKFYKVDKARTRAYGGSGIGLSIVRAIMKMHRHACGVENRADGVSFWFELDGVEPE